MASVLNVATIMVCMSLMTLAVAMALTFMWLFEKREKAVAWWCAGMWVGTVSLVLLAARFTTPWWFGIGLGNAGALLAYGLLWSGFSAFRGRPAHWGAIVAGSLFWFVCVYGFESIRSDVNDRIIVSALGTALYCALVVRECWLTWKQERLPSLVAAAFFYASHGLFYLIRIPLTILYPVREVDTFEGFGWYTVTTLEAFVHGLFASFVLVALIRERAERRYRLAAEIDSLTSASSRRHFVSEVRAALARKPRAGVLAMLDLDFFKKINDTYGHMAGDRVLQTVAYHVSAGLRPGMVFGRLGGEEFGLFLPDCSVSEAAGFLENLRAGVETLDIRFNGNVLKVTTSIGAASVEEAGLDFDHLMAGADNALYLAKDRGRNRICIFSLAMRLEAIVEGGRQTRVSLSKRRVSRISVRSKAGRS